MKENIMASEYEIPVKIQRYVNRLSVEYRRNGQNDLADVLEGSKVKVTTETAFENWGGGSDGHDVVFYVPDRLMGNIPLDEQQEIQSQIARDLNTASSSITSEFINEVHFEYLDDASVDQNAGDEESSRAHRRLWRPDAIRLFISHRDTVKKEAHALADALVEFGVSSFVAHDSIEPDEDWQGEIEKALQSMNVMLAFITDDFFDSAWTNQEIGFALATNIPVISLKLGSRDPTGFIRNRQAIKGGLGSVVLSAEAVAATIEKRLGPSSSVRSAFLGRFINAMSFRVAADLFEKIRKRNEWSEEDIEKMVLAFNSNNQLKHCFALTQDSQFLDFINANSSKSRVQRGDEIKLSSKPSDSEIPF
tara:strand:+ start:1743 stop:2831 length:1089 start_codon:yes stop_codon:yes gene_type:complete